MPAMATTPYFDELRRLIMGHGGLFNAHLHLCRAGTLEETQRILAAETDYSGLSLIKKHSIIPLIHESAAYERSNLRERLAYFLEQFEQVGTTRADTCTDITTRLGLSVFEECSSAKAGRAARIDLRLGAYTPLGYKDAEPEAWRLIEVAARTADFIGALPERDELGVYPDHIGYEENCRRTLSLAASLGKPIHIHVDQKNDPNERGTFRVLSVIDELGLTYPEAEPLVWLVHVISPSAYDDGLFADMVAQLAEKNIGVICCPSAAISMRQLRPNVTPTHNCIARVLEFLAEGVQVRIGSDNIDDITSPAGTTDLVDELFLLANAIRFYDLGILAKLGAGRPLDNAERRKIQQHLENDAAETMIAVTGNLNP
jgi:cytosine deaminase